MSGRTRGRAEGRTGFERGASPEAGLIGDGGRRRGRPGVGGVACRVRTPDQHGGRQLRDAGETRRTLMLAWSFSRNVCCAVTAVESPFFGVSGCGREGSVSALALPDGRHSRGSERKEGTYRSAEPILEPLPLLDRDGVEPLGHEDEQVVLDERHRGAERDAALGVGAREWVVRDEERELVRGDEGGDRGEEAREGEVVCAAWRSVRARPRAGAKGGERRTEACLHLPVRVDLQGGEREDEVSMGPSARGREGGDAQSRSPCRPT